MRKRSLIWQHYQVSEEPNHHNKRPGSCQICGIMYMEAARAVYHVRKNHYSPQAMEFACPNYGCSVTASSSSELIAHLSQTPGHGVSAGLPHAELVKFIRPKPVQALTQTPPALHSPTAPIATSRHLEAGPAHFLNNMPPPPIMGQLQLNQPRPFANPGQSNTMIGLIKNEAKPMQVSAPTFQVPLPPATSQPNAAATDPQPGIITRAIEQLPSRNMGNPGCSSWPQQ